MGKHLTYGEIEFIEIYSKELRKKAYESLEAHAT